MNIAVDIDEVCCRFVKGFLDYYNTRCGTSIKKREIVKWEWWDIPGVDITRESFKKVFEEFSRNRMWQGLKAYGDAKNVLCALAEDGHSIYYMTDRPRDARRTTLKYLLKEGFPVDSVIFAKGNQKADIARALDISIAIDDKPETIQNYLNNRIRAVLRVQPHNRDVNFDIGDDVRLYRCNNLTEFYNVVKNIKIDVSVKECRV